MYKINLNFYRKSFKNPTQIKVIKTKPQILAPNNRLKSLDFYAFFGNLSNSGGFWFSWGTNSNIFEILNP